MPKFEDLPLQDVTAEQKTELRQAIADYLKLVQQADGSYENADRAKTKTT
jgi:hypothetical protein